MGKTFLSVIASVLAATLPALGSVDPSHHNSHSNTALYENTQGPLTAREIFEHTEQVLQGLGISPEADFSADLRPLASLQSQAGAQTLLPILDPKGQFKRFTEEISDKDGRTFFAGFQDFDSKQISDFTVELTPKAVTPKLLPLPALTNNARPLTGIRIALDPGHMGGDVWDVRTGKYVTDHKGHKVSEGVINLQTALLLKSDLEALGATVLVTHETLAPVATTSWEDLSIPEYAARELRADTLDPWFLDLLQTGQTGTQLIQSFKDSPQFKRLYTEEMRLDYFVLEADLQARAELIRQFNPDLTLIIHYDTDDPPNDPVGVSPNHRDATKTYVPGAVQPEEFATRENRAKFMEHLLNPDAFASSVQFAHHILSSMESNMKLPPDSASGETVAIEPGLMARNLNLDRDLTNTTITFVECLFYNDPTEFQTFQDHDHEMDIGGVQTFYSNRLVQVEQALEKGILSYVQAARQTSFSSRAPTIVENPAHC